MRRIPIIPVACQYGEKTLPQSWHGGPLFLKPDTLPEIYLKGEQLVLRHRGKVCYQCLSLRCSAARIVFF